MTKNIIRIKRALISVFDKTNIVEFASQLQSLGIEIISTGGTSKLLLENKVPVVNIEDITEFPEILGGRVKTLHPNIYGGILSRLNNDEDSKALQNHNITEIDLVVVNLYPFQKTIESNNSIEEIVENIDIGGPSMIRASAKNYERVTIVTNSEKYSKIISQIQKQGGLDLEERMKLAAEAFALTSSYDNIISNWFSSRVKDTNLNNLKSKNSSEKLLRYGENPHQSASLKITGENGFGSIEQLQGKELSYNNINDIDAAMQLINDFFQDRPTFAIIKHANPCGVAQKDTILDAYLSALSCDPTSAFGGILISNSTIDEETATEITKIFSEVVIAPDFTEKSIEIFNKKKNLRIIKYNNISDNDLDTKLIKSVYGGYLIQDRDTHIVEKEQLKIVTNSQPTESELNDLIFAFKIVKHVKSNAIVYVKNMQTIGIGAGQTSRVDSSKIAIQKFYENIPDNKFRDGCVIASDAFFPFSDGLDAAIEFGVKSVIQPGGSIRDEEVIETANKAKISMVFTGIRHFKH
tara:strand:- start:1506 stop:3074 length:1569 start_codon:yes stop_codon:yes gene_type:complete